MAAKKNKPAKSAKKARSKKAATKKSAPKKVVAKKAIPKRAAKAKPPAARRRTPAKAPRALAAEPFEVATIVQEEIFEAAPMDVYEAFVDPAKHAAFTGSAATGEPIEGGTFTAWAGYIEGRHERLVPGARIVQIWRTSEFPDGHPDSRIELELRPESENKTRLRLTHSGVPRTQAKKYEQGWVDSYWEPLRAYFRDTAHLT